MEQIYQLKYLCSVVLHLRDVYVLVFPDKGVELVSSWSFTNSTYRQIKKIKKMHVKCYNLSSINVTKSFAPY